MLGLKLNYVSKRGHRSVTAWCVDIILEWHEQFARIIVIFLLEIWQWPAVANVLHISDGHERLGSAKPGVCITIAAISRFGRPFSQWVSGFHLKAVLSLVKSLQDTTRRTNSTKSQNDYCWWILSKILVENHTECLIRHNEKNWVSFTNND